MPETGWMICGRQGGKTTRMLEWLEEDPEHRVVVCHSEHEADRLYHLCLQRAEARGDPGSDWSAEDPKGLRRKCFFSAGSGWPSLRGRQVEFGVDNVDLVLEQLLGVRVSLAAATGEIIPMGPQPNPGIRKGWQPSESPRPNPPANPNVPATGLRRVW